MTTRRRRTTRRRVQPQTLEAKMREEVFWTVATLALIVATVIFVPILFAAVK